MKQQRKEEIIRRIMNLDRGQLLQLRQLLDQLENHPEKQTAGKEPELKEPEVLK